MSHSILFVCNLNAVRSVMAQYMIQRWYDNSLTAQSCGVIAGPPDGYAASICLEHDIDITDHESRYLSDIDVTAFDEIISFSEDAAAELGRLALPDDLKISHWQVRDFAGIGTTRDERLVVYRGVFADIEKQIMAHFGPKNG